MENAVGVNEYNSVDECVWDLCWGWGIQDDVDKIIDGFNVKKPSLFNYKIKQVFKKFENDLTKAWDGIAPYIIIQRAIVMLNNDKLKDILSSYYSDNHDYVKSIEKSTKRIKDYLKRKKVNKDNFVDLLNFVYDDAYVEHAESDLMATFIEYGLFDFWEDLKKSLISINTDNSNYKLAFNFEENKVETFSFNLLECDSIDSFSSFSRTEIFDWVKGILTQFENIDRVGLVSIELISDDKSNIVEEEELRTLLRA